MAEIGTTEPAFTQEDYDKFFNILQAFFNIKTELKHAIETMKQPGYTRPTDKDWPTKVDNAYKTCCDWLESMSEAVSKISDDQKTYKWLSKAVENFRADITEFKQLNHIE